jgi:hypothetical protein
MADSDSTALSGRSALAAQALKVAQSTRLELAVLSFALDPDLYGSEPFVDAVKTFLLGEDRARLRVLLNQPRVVAQSAHRLVELGRRLTSRVEFRELAQEQLNDMRGEWLIADRRRILERRNPETLTAHYWDSAPLLAREKLEKYDSLWNEAVPCGELQRLAL